VTGLRLVLLAGCLSCATMWVLARSPVPATATYVGSAACGRCHAPTFERWKNTRMASVVRDPREHPEAIVGDFSTPNPFVTFTTDQIAFVYVSIVILVFVRPAAHSRVERIDRGNLIAGNLEVKDHHS
jgi:hypothetical protein